MSRGPSNKQAPFPSKSAVVKFIQEQPAPPTKRDIAKAFHIRGNEPRVMLKQMIRELEKEGILPNKRARRSGDAPKRQAPDVLVVEVIGYSPSGDLQGVKLDEETKERDENSVPFIIKCTRNEDPQPGDHALVRRDLQDLKNRETQLLRILPERLTHLLGIFQGEGEHGTIEPVDRKIKESFCVHGEHTMGAKDGELVYCKIIGDLGKAKRGRKKSMLRAVEILERVGRLDEPRSASLIAIHNHDIPMEFPREAVRIAEAAKAPEMKDGRVDLREFDLVTIDGADARDFDDAVWAKKEGKDWHVLVAIADVAHYVRFGSELDNEAFRRGNSVYFPDRVVPMLPEALSNGLCSLNPDEDRYCLAVHLWIDAEGNTKKYEFVRGLMRSKARLTYDQVQAAFDGEPDHVPAEILESVIKPLYGVYDALNNNRTIRGALDLDLPEHKATIDQETGQVTSIELRERFDSHKLIEECMIAANVAAAHAIETADAPGMFRVHETPDYARVTDLRGFLKQMGYAIAKSENLSAHHFNAVLEKAKDQPEAHVIHMAILRSQMAAYYDPKNVGHFGLSLEQYCHFTSPIRRYSDLIVHRTLINLIDAVDVETDGLVPEQAENLESIATHISQTERRAMLAEREANDRYLTNFMKDKVGKEFEAIIATVTSFGFFVELKENGAQGLVPTRSLGRDFYLFDKEKSQLIGRSTGETFSLGQKLRVLLMEADTTTGSLRFGLVGREIQGKPGKPRGPKPGKKFGGKPKGGHKGKGKFKGKSKGKR